MSQPAARYLARVVLEVTGDSLTIHRDAGLDVTAGRVSAIGPLESLPDLDPGIPVHDCGGLLMPGLVNIHAHSPMVMLRSAGDGFDLDHWLSDVIWPREAQLTPDDVHLAMLAGSAELLTSGVTTTMEMYFHDEAIVEAVQITGSRLVLTPGIIAPIHDPDDRLAEIADLRARHHRPGGRVTVGFGPHSTYNLSVDALGAIGRAVADLDAIVHIHLEETRQERDLVLERTGRTATQLLADHDLLGPRTVGAHGVWLDDDDRALLADAGATIAHCPHSNLRLGCGIADIAGLRSAGVNVGFGTDGPASADSLDLWRELHLAPGLARATHHDPEALSVEDTLIMATAGAGRALGDGIGSLTVGSPADFLRLDIDHPVFQPGLDEHDLLTHVVFNGAAQHVTDVWVDGDQVVADRRCLAVDRDELTAALTARAAAISV